MTSTGSITVWIEELRHGDETNSPQIWNCYVKRLIKLARKKMSGMQTRVSDEEDLVSAAFNSFFMGMRDGRFSKLQTRDDLWQVLVMLAERRIVDQQRQNLAKKRGSGNVRGESVFKKADNGSRCVASLDGVAGSQPTPEFALNFLDELGAVLGKLRGDKVLEQIVLLKFQGFNNLEIAERTGCSLSSVERKLRLIRDLWHR